MAIKLDEKGKERDIFALGFDELERAAKVDDTYNIVNRYWECVKKVYGDLIKSQNDEGVILDVLKVLNTSLYFNWRVDRIVIGNPPRDYYGRTRMAENVKVLNTSVDFKWTDGRIVIDNPPKVYERNHMTENVNLEDITFKIFFNERSFYYKLLKKEQSLKEDCKNLIKYLRSSFLRKIKSQRASILKKQIVNSSENDYRINPSGRSMDAIDVLRCSQSRPVFEKVINSCNITKNEFNNALSKRMQKSIQPGGFYYSAWQRQNGFEPCKIVRPLTTYGSPISSDSIGLIVGCEELQIPLDLTVRKDYSPDTPSLDRVYEEFFNIVRNGFDTQEEMLLDIVKNQTIFENLIGRSELSSAHYIGLSLKDIIFDDSNFEWVKIVKQ